MGESGFPVIISIPVRYTQNMYIYIYDVSYREGCIKWSTPEQEAYDELNAYENAKREQESGKPTDSHEGCSCVLQ